MSMKRLIMVGAALFFSLFLTQAAMAKVSQEEAEKLKTTLTPFGAERAGNADGTIPAWEGGISAPPEGLGYKGSGFRHPDPYAKDNVRYSITAENMAQYDDKLTEGQKALFKKHPDTYRIDVYPTRRSHAAPDWVYENTFQNATRAEVTEGGLQISSAYGGIPFPIPKSGEEVIWNHLLRFESSGTLQESRGYLVESSGKIVLANGIVAIERFPYYIKDGSLDTFNGYYYYTRSAYNQPPRRKGEVLLVKDPVNPAITPRKAWQYLVGQRRVRRAPTVAFDTPNPSFAGATTWDDYYMFNGSLERYDWKLLGKKEILIPYNCYKADEQMELKEIYQKGHLNPDYIRWELHRVWEVEATVKPDKRHIYGRRLFYVDEDSWVMVMADSYDNRGKLWRTNLAINLNAYELPGVVQRMQVNYDLPKDRYALNLCQTDLPKIREFGYESEESMFTPEAVRRLGRR